MNAALTTHAKVLGDSITEYYEFEKKQFTTGTLGRIGIWNEITTYHRNDMVRLAKGNPDVYLSRVDNNYRKHPEKNSDAWLLTDINTQGFGLDAQKRFRNAVDNFSNIFLSVYAFEKDLFQYDNPKGGKTHYSPSFCTITVPQPKLSDLDNKLLFDRWMENCVKTHRVKMYIWRAEAQLRGAIHFHIAFDRYMDRDRIKKTWWNALRDSNQHNENLSFEQHSHILHIQQIDKIEALKFELSGYFSADEAKDEAGNVLKDEEGNKLYKYKHDKTKTVRKINGRGWGYSDSLKYESMLIQSLGANNSYLVDESKPLLKRAIETKEGFVMGMSHIYKQIFRNPQTKEREIKKSPMNRDMGKLMVLYHYLHACNIYGSDKVHKPVWDMIMENGWSGMRTPKSFCSVEKVNGKKIFSPLTFEQFKDKCFKKKQLQP